MFSCFDLVKGKERKEGWEQDWTSGSRFLARIENGFA